jgi:hypothetical protein
MHGGPPHASALAPKGFEDLSPRQFAEREADMATSNALYQKAWDASISEANVVKWLAHPKVVAARRLK